MKKFFVFVLPLLLVFSAHSHLMTRSAFANSNYARILNEKTVFYANPDCTIQSFFLPYGYFVKILKVGANSTRVSYMDGSGNLPERVGYIKTSDLYFFEGEVTCPYPDVSLTIKTDEVLFADSDLQYPKTVLAKGQEATLYGEFEILGESFCYVYAGGFIGYVRSSAFNDFLLPDHPIPIQTESPEKSEEGVQSTLEEQNSQLKVDDTLKIVIVVALCIVSISVVYLIFKPKSSTIKCTPLCDEDDYF